LVKESDDLHTLRVSLSVVAAPNFDPARIYHRIYPSFDPASDRGAV